jgi:hypothetical protein
MIKIHDVVIVVLLFLTIVTSCSQFQSEENKSTLEEVISDDNEVAFQDTLDVNGDWEFADYWLVIADTSSNYQKLHTQMVQLGAVMKIEIDTLGRYFDTTMQRIQLPYDDEDEMYAGQYFPRRFSGIFLSIEHPYYMLDNPVYNSEDMAIVVAIFDDEMDAKIFNEKVRQYCKTSFVQYAKTFVGCMH